MNEVTSILSSIEQGDPHAAEQLLPLVYDELRKLAAQKLTQERPGQTLQATALVHEAYIRLVDAEKARHSDSRGHFLGGQRPEDEGSDRPFTERAGMVIGPYTLMEQIGEGGMGLVFVAEQQHPVRRKVAVKVIKPGMDTREVIARFEAERQGLALMEHPNIARVLDAGTTSSGRPYFVMELVRGVPITEFCDEHQLAPRERLELFVHVCQAVQHAHQKGIIHRDLKASNIRITLHDGAPVVKVIDFGVAKAIGQRLTDKTVYTRFTQLIGTPIYMSPEQAELSGLDIDTRSDIYSLGVLLYELLTGMTPFDAERLRTASFDEMRRIVREEEPPRPSKRISTLGHATTGTVAGTRGRAVQSPVDDGAGGDGARSVSDDLVRTSHPPYDLATIAARRRSDPRRLSQLLRGELDWIVMKALEKDRTRRYDTAGAFAADVLRYLRDEPVQAHPPTIGYRLRKFVRWNRAPVLAASLVMLALVMGIMGTIWGMIRAERARQRAVSAQFEEAERAEGERAAKEEAQKRLAQLQNS